MRIQHNIMAMNAYRNMGVNNRGLAKNLEKLSSGYRINRAGDDAAGLAISEKMRAQIAGLDQAQQNAQSGINLVQTAEGALTEVHDMLNRMVTLANQSANGTYEGLDREQLQKEVDNLKTEIDRIADSSNFNGIKLLDGSMNAGAGASKIYDLNSTDEANFAAGQKVKNTIQFKAAAETKGEKVSMTLKYQDKDGNLAEVTVEDTVTATAASDVANALFDEIKEVFDGYNVTVSGDTITIEALNEGADLTKLLESKTVINGVEKTEAADKTVVTQVTAGKDKQFTMNFGAVNIGTATAAAKSFTIDGTKFEVVSKGKTAAAGSVALYVDQTTGTLNKDSVKQINEQLKAYGLNVEVDPTAASNGLKINIKHGTGSDGLSLQIGDSGASFNQLKVSIKDVHADALGLSSVNVADQGAAKTSVDAIKKAINMVSDVRGTLGATQNRLEHTINNLSVMQENIQDAESTIRDTDIAAEMMKYTKNNILIQSAQAMLAQANQVPQGVLQLMQ